MSTEPPVELPPPWLHGLLDEAAHRALRHELPASALWSLLLGVTEARALAREPAELMQQWRRDRFVAPSNADPRALLGIDTVLWHAAAAFEAVELSPLAPLASCVSVAPGSQNRIVSTARGTEVVSDPTNVLALECAARLAAGPTSTVRLAASHRCVRAQPFPDQPGFAAHFRLFCAVTAGRELPNQAFTTDALIEHIEMHLRALDALEPLGYAFGPRVLRLLASDARTGVADRVATRIASTHAQLAVERARLDSRYYDGLRFMIDALPGGSADRLPLIDGGAFDWLETLAQDRKQVMVASAIGTQLLATRCKAQRAR